MMAENKYIKEKFPKRLTIEVGGAIYHVLNYKALQTWAQNEVNFNEQLNITKKFERVEQHGYNRRKVYKNYLEEIRIFFDENTDFRKKNKNVFFS